MNATQTVMGANFFVFYMKCAGKLVFLMVLLAAPLWALEPGLYNFSDEAHPTLLKDKVARCRLISQTKDNKRFELRLEAASSFSLPYTDAALVVDGKTFRFDRASTSKGATDSMGFMFDDLSLIPGITNLFPTKIYLRHHPGQQMLVEFVPAKAEFELGEAVQVMLRITNVGMKDFAFMEGGRQRGPRNNQFAFTAEHDGKAVPDTGDSLNFGGMVMKVAVKPGKSFEISVDLKKWFDFKESGTYRIRGSYYMRFMEAEDKDFNPIWEDFAAGEFDVVIKAKDGQ